MKFDRRHVAWKIGVNGMNVRVTLKHIPTGLQVARDTRQLEFLGIRREVFEKLREMVENSPIQS